MNKKTVYKFRIFLMFVIYLMILLAALSILPGPPSSDTNLFSRLHLYIAPGGGLALIYLLKLDENLAAPFSILSYGVCAIVTLYLFIFII